MERVFFESKLAVWQVSKLKTFYGEDAKDDDALFYTISSTFIMRDSSARRYLFSCNSFRTEECEKATALKRGVWKCLVGRTIYSQERRVEGWKKKFVVGRVHGHLSTLTWTCFKWKSAVGGVHGAALVRNRRWAIESTKTHWQIPDHVGTTSRNCRQEIK